MSKKHYYTIIVYYFLVKERLFPKNVHRNVTALAHGSAAPKKQMDRYDYRSFFYLMVIVRFCRRVKHGLMQANCIAQPTNMCYIGSCNEILFYHIDHSLFCRH
jgi:hypothetical protein